MSNPKILVVDDEQDMLLIMQTTLEDAGFEVVTAQNSPEGKSLLASEIPDLVVTDIMMPGESGYSLISYLRENDLFKKIPVIAISSLDAEVEVLKIGADAYLPKPFEPDELVDLIQQMIKKADLPALMKKAVDLLKSKKLDEAKEILESILESGGRGSYPAYAAFYLGEISRISGSQEEAESFYKQALQMTPDFWRAYAQLGKISYDRQDVRRALGYWKRALQLNPEQPKLKDVVEKLEKGLEG